VQGPAKVRATSLRDGVIRAFPAVNREKLAAWVKEVRRLPAVEAEQLLFAILLCGVRLGVYGPAIAAVQAELHQWLTWHPRKMRAELADLLVEALTPGLSQAVERQGARVGPWGTPGLKGGRPPLATSAWTAAAVVEHRLRLSDATNRRARELAHALAALLLGRTSVEPYEFYRERKRRGVDAVARLALGIARQYEWWVLHDGVRQSDEPPPGNDRAYGVWHRKHRSLAWVLKAFGSESVARVSLRRLPDDMWTRFLSPATRERELSRGSHRG